MYEALCQPSQCLFDCVGLSQAPLRYMHRTDTTKKQSEGSDLGRVRRSSCFLAKSAHGDDVSKVPSSVVGVLRQPPADFMLRGVSSSDRCRVTPQTAGQRADCLETKSNSSARVRPLNPGRRGTLQRQLTGRNLAAPEVTLCLYSDTAASYSLLSVYRAADAAKPHILI